MTRVLWAGISYKRNRSGILMEPLDLRSPTGQIVKAMAAEIPDADHYFDNVVNYAPETQEGASRAVTNADFERCWGDFWNRVSELSPSRVVFFGGQVASFAKSIGEIPKVDKYQITTLRGCAVVFCDHPSYYNVYRKKLIPEYVKRVAEAVSLCSAKRF